MTLAGKLAVLRHTGFGLTQIHMAKKIFKQLSKLSQDDLNLAEAKGWVIDTLNEVERAMSYIITNHFQPAKNEEQFKQIILNSSVIGYGPKAKSLHGMKVISKALYDKIMRLGSIRNGFAHTIVSHHYKLYANRKKENEITQAINVMSSDGIVRKQDSKTYFNEFVDLSKQIIEELDLILRRP
jgi:hypothetical protein